MRPLLFLDIDGVLNCLGSGEECEQLEVSGAWGAFAIALPQGVRERLRELERRFEIVWATAWFDEAPLVLAAAGLDDLGPWPVLEYNDLKLTAIAEHAGGRPFAWIDDDVSFELAASAGGPRFAQPHLLCEVDPNTGLDDAALGRLLAFAAALEAQGAR